jgi:hypothetical protein
MAEDGLSPAMQQAEQAHAAAYQAARQALAEVRAALAAEDPKAVLAAAERFAAAADEMLAVEREHGQG